MLLPWLLLGKQKDVVTVQSLMSIERSTIS